MSVFLDKKMFFDETQRYWLPLTFSFFDEFYEQNFVCDRFPLPTIWHFGTRGAHDVWI